MQKHLEAGPSNQLRIKEIASLIDQLSTELQQRLNLEFAPSSPGNSSSSYKSIKSFIFPQKPPPFAIGERVVITNNYRNLKGRIGSITRITRTFVFLKLDNSTDIIQKRKQNVERLNDDA